MSLTAPEYWADFGTTGPTCGRLADAHLLQSGAVLGADVLTCPLVEPELVFVIEQELSPAAGPEEVRAHTSVCAGLEIPDSRYAGWYPIPEQQAMDLVSDNSFAGRVVEGRARVPTADLDLPNVQCLLRLDEDVIGEGRGEAVLDDPINAVVWLSAHLAESGMRLHPGQRVSSGTFFYPPVAQPGRYTATYSGIGEVSVTFG